ncbi:hypothetical protein [Alkalihalobacterium elongatum]|uniref:hypothetical protein n=1 Tax=Alkalihalobacterium elongatum TaxID=2675466 RepID=UPI001C1F3CED|nr:hypothetical protein [Alkalihalobacterium elongatum]
MEEWCHLKKIFIVILIVITVFAIIVGIRWNHLTNLSETSTIVVSYLKNEGFFVLYHSDDFGLYTITNNELTEKPYSDYLKVQNKNLEFYVDKKLHHEFFYVNNHPLSNLFGFGHIHVTVIMSENEVVGASSTKDGMTYPLHGE